MGSIILLLRRLWPRAVALLLLFQFSLQDSRNQSTAITQPIIKIGGAPLSPKITAHSGRSDTRIAALDPVDGVKPPSTDARQVDTGACPLKDTPELCSSQGGGRCAWCKARSACLSAEEACFKLRRPPTDPSPAEEPRPRTRDNGDGSQPTNLPRPDPPPRPHPLPGIPRPEVHPPPAHVPPASHVHEHGGFHGRALRRRA